MIARPVPDGDHTEAGLREALLAPSFTRCPIENAVFWGSTRLSPESIEDLLNVFQREGCAAAYNALHDAELQAGGIPRCSNLRAA